MEWKELVRRRYSCRSYMEMPVAEETLTEILEEVRLAPSAANRQPWVFYVVREPEVKEALREAYDKEWFYKAPVVIVACGNRDESWRRSYDGASSLEIDVAIAVDHLTLAAADRGLGTCWIGAFNPEPVRRILRLPENIVPLALTPLGYPADEPKPKKRKLLDEIVRYV